MSNLSTTKDLVLWMSTGPLEITLHDGRNGECLFRRRFGEGDERQAHALFARLVELLGDVVEVRRG